MYYLYILYSETSQIYYVGSTEDPCKRFEEHNTDPDNTFTSKHRPWLLKAVFEAGTKRSNAMKMERFIKQQKSRKLIDKLIDPAFTPNGALAQLVRVPHVRD